MGPHHRIIAPSIFGWRKECSRPLGHHNFIPSARQSSAEHNVDAKKGGGKWQGGVAEVQTPLCPRLHYAKGKKNKNMVKYKENFNFYIFFWDDTPWEVDTL